MDKINNSKTDLNWHFLQGGIIVSGVLFAGIIGALGGAFIATMLKRVIKNSKYTKN